MLSNAADYRYLTPLAQGIHGGILPAVDGTASAGVAAYEDYCHLVEMARERRHWSFGHGLDYGVAEAFDPASVVAERSVIRGNGSLSDRLAWSIDWNASIAGTLVPSSWNPAALLPAISVGPLGSAVDQLRDGAAYGHAMPSTGSVSDLSIPPVVEADTLRYLYREYGDMRRYLFRSSYSSIYTESEFAALDDWDQVFHHLAGAVQMGDRTVTDSSGGGSSSTSSTAAFPWYERDFRTGYTTSSVSTIRYYVRSPFWTNPVTKVGYYEGMAAYFVFGGTAKYRRSAAESMAYPYDMVCEGVPSALRVQAAPGVQGADGCVDVAFAGPILVRFWNTAVNLLQTHAPEDEATSSLEYVSLQLRQVLLDTGVVVHNTALPETWTWRPQGGGQGNS